MKVTDPVCRMNIEVTNAFDKTAYKDTTYYFCSESCRDKFSKNPVDYLTEKPSGCIPKFSRLALVHAPSAVWRLNLLPR
jgi:Cu+-exporting ATPase